MDQTGFSQNQEIFQAPPEPVKTPEQLAPPTPEELAKKKKQNLIIGIVFCSNCCFSGIDLLSNSSSVASNE